MSRRPPAYQPFDFPAPEPARNAGGTPLPNIVRGTELFAELTGLTAGLPMLTEATALTVSAIYACVSLIAGAIATLPIRVYQRAEDGELTELPSDPLVWLLNEQMLPRWSAANGWEFSGQSKLIRGDAYQKIHRTLNGTIVGFEPLHYDRVVPVPTPDGRRLVYSIAPDWTVPNRLQNDFEVLDQDDVLHFAGFGFDGVRGLSPLRYWLRMTGAVALSAQEYSARFFANGARPDYVLGTDSALSPEVVDKLRSQIDQKHRGVEQAHRPLVLTNGLKPFTLGLPAEDMQLLATREFQIEEVARVYGIPPFMIGHTETTTSWGSGVAAMGEGFVRYALRKHLNKFENELNRKLFATARKVVAFDTTDLEQADFGSLIAAFRNALGQPGAQPMMTVEEIRQRLKLKRTPTYGSLDPKPTTSPTPPKPGAADAPDQAAEPAGA